MKAEDILFLLVLLLFVQGYLFQNVFPALLAFLIVVYIVYLRLEFLPRINASREMDTKLTEGEKVKSKLKLKNLTNKKLVVKVIEELPFGFKSEEPTIKLGEWEEKEVEYFVIPKRGKYTVAGPRLQVKDLRGLYYTDYQVPSKIEVEVYPSIEKIKEDAKTEENIRLATTYQKILMGLQTLEIHSLRRFQPGDETKHIDWKATARLGELIVKDFLREIEGDIYIILDAGREMRKSIRKSKIDYATTLTLQLLHVLQNYRVGLIVYDDYGVINRIEASKSPDQIKKAVRSLAISPIFANLIPVRATFDLKIPDESRKFLAKIMPIFKGKKSFATGLIEAISVLPSAAFLIFISDIIAHTGELIKVLSELKDKYKILLITPNPILFYDESKLNKETLLWLYKRYLEREELIRKLNRIVPTLDLGPSDLIDVVRGALK